MHPSSRLLLAFPVAVATVGCTPPPPAPEGLDASTSYLVEEFWADDPTFQAGIQGFVQWFEDEGKALVGQGATLENSDTFSVNSLSEANVQYLPLDDELVQDIQGGEDVMGPREIGRAAGVVSLAEMDCTIEEALGYLVRPDQDAVFSGDWEGYDRTYIPADSRERYQQAMDAREFTPIPERLDPFGPDFDATEYQDTLLFTDNMADPTQVLVANLPSYPLDLDFRQGVYELADGGEAAAFSIITYNPAAVWAPQGNNALIQSFSIEVNVERPGGKVLRMLAVWAEPKGSGIDPDSALARNYAVNKSLASSNQISAICAGDIVID